MNRHKVVLFMKGNPSAPKCGFSRQIVGLLRERGVEFAWYDILSDQAVREGLKKMNDWPSESLGLGLGLGFRAVVVETIGKPHGDFLFLKSERNR
jgi:hypothetical protein